MGWYKKEKYQKVSIDGALKGFGTQINESQSKTIRKYIFQI